MYRDTPSTQVADPQDTTDHISSEIVKDEDLPDGFSVGIQYRCRLWREAVDSRRVIVRFCVVRRDVVKIEDSFNRACSGQRPV